MEVIGRSKSPHIPNNRYIIRQQQDDVCEYTDTIRNLWSNYNKSVGLSSVNLCQCIRHYDKDTLGNVNNSVNYKNYKKMTLKKMKTKRKNELKQSEKLFHKKIHNYESENKRLTKYLQRLKDDAYKEEQKSNKNKNCIDKIDNYLNDV
tara:strand:- start:49 stop:492 length:444 start_codon:yes stop_codon:yes gene_type:complete